MKIGSSKAFFQSLACLAFASILLVSCGRKTAGYGVLLWSPDEKIHRTGSVVPIYDESKIKKTSIIPGRSEKEDLEIPSWRLAAFAGRDKAEAYAKSFEPFSYLFGQSDRSGLPVREKPDRLSERSYKLRDKETVKVLEKGTSLSDENGLKGYWLKVLTEGGTVGFCFDLYLSLFDARSNTRLSGGLDPAAEESARILSSDWRPSYFQEMIAENRIDLARFKPEYGLFFNQTKKTVRVSLPGRAADFPFTGLSQIRPHIWLVEGSQLKISLKENNEAYLEYSRENTPLTANFTAMEQEVETVIKAELERRAALAKSLADRGPRFESSAYGSLTVSANGSFTWLGAERLMPTVVPDGVTEKGSFDFSIFPSREIAKNYDGGITLKFSGGKAASFLYKILSDGIRLVHVPPASLKDNLVQRESMNPAVLVFTKAP